MSRFLIAGLVTAFVASVSITAYLLFDNVRAIVASMTSLFPPIQISENLKIPLPDLPYFDIHKPLQPDGGPVPNAWDGDSPLTILLMGVDTRDWVSNNGPPLSDTMILVKVDPILQNVGILSIPRDLWVDIPYYGYHKINQAIQLGEATGIDGGGAGLAIQTVAQFLGVDVDFYAYFDFNAFVALVDGIDGVKLEIEDEIVIDPLGESNTVVLQPGVHTLSGDLALAYARNRNTLGGDFDRAQRQQQVVLAMRNRVLEFELLPTLLARAPRIYTDISNGVQSNLSLNQVIKLAWIAQQIPEENIRQGVIGPNEVLFGISPNGLSVLQPLQDRIFELRDQIFNPGGTIAPLPGSDGDIYELMLLEEAAISLLNATNTVGLAANTDIYLRDQGINAVEVGNADQLYSVTTIIDHSGKPNTIAFLTELFGIPPHNFYHQLDPSKTVDVVIFLGNDWAANNPMP